MPVWGAWLDDGFHFGTSVGSPKARNLDRDPRIVVHLESGDEAVILEGEVERIELDARISDAFPPKYDWRPDPTGDGGGRWYRLRPRLAYAWLERDYPRTATRFSFTG
jgi:hypothetical protein